MVSDLVWLLFISLTLLVPSRGFATAVIQYGKSCDVTSADASVNKKGVNTYQLSVKYTMNCEDGTNPNPTYYQNLSRSEQDKDEWYWVKRVPGSASYNLSTLEIKIYDDGWFWPDLIKTVKDPFLAIGQSTPIQIWRAPEDGNHSIQQYDKYDADRMTMAANTPQSALGFNGTNDLNPTANPYIAAKFFFKPNPLYWADLVCFPGVGDVDLFNKPILVSDAFDPFDNRTAAQIYSTPQYSNLLSTTHVSAPRKRGYDIWFLNFKQGGGDLIVNAQLLLRALQWMQSKTTSKIIIGGPSMSGLVSRTALLYSMPANNVHGLDLARGVKGYLSIDSPHRGASISPSMQKAVHEVKTDKSLNFIIDINNYVADVTNGSLVDGQANSAGENWDQLCVAGAHQMLYGHYYPGRGHLNTAFSAFQEFLQSKGGFRMDIPRVAIATSNFWIPNASLSRSATNTVGKIAPPGAVRNFNAGGVDGMHNHELEPGSTGDWFFSPYKKKSPEFVTAYSFTNEKFKGTFVPISSALALNGNFDVYNPQTTDEIGLRSWSTFNAVYYLQQPYNGYPGSSGGIEDRRYEHIVFDDQVMEKIKLALIFIESKEAVKTLSAIVSLLN